MIVPSEIIDFAQRHQQFLFGLRSENDWPIEAHRVRSLYLLFLAPAVAERLYGNGEAYNCAGALVAALGDVTPLPFENAQGQELGTLCKESFPGIKRGLILYGGDECLTYLSWWLRHERTGYYLRLPQSE